MKALVICPDPPAALPFLARKGPLALMPALGPSLLQHALHSLAEAGAREVVVLTSDRGEQIRVALGSGERWGLRIEVVVEPRELSLNEACRKYGADESGARSANRHPDAPDFAGKVNPLSWLEGLQAALPLAHRHRVGVREIAPEVWTGLRTQIEPGAKVVGPCWLGEDVRIGAGATVGPGSVVEDLVLIDREAEVVDSWIGPHTYVGAMTHVNRSLAWGNQLLNCDSRSWVEVPDAFLLADLAERPKRAVSGSLPGQLADLFSAMRRLWRGLSRS